MKTRPDKKSGSLVVPREYGEFTAVSRPAQVFGMGELPAGCSAAGAAPADSRPSLSVEEQLKQEPGQSSRSGKAVKVSYCIEHNVGRLAAEYGIGHLAFLTLTFADDVQELQEATKRFNSLNTGVLSKRGFGPWVRIAERQASGKVHFHLVIVVPKDIRTGYNAETGRGSGAGWVWLTRERKFLLGVLPRYSFGRAELVPLKKESIAAARYLAKYLVKSVGYRLPKDRRFRLVAYSRKFLWLRPEHFSFARGGAKLWRLKVTLWAFKNGYYDFDDVTYGLGYRWAFNNRDTIILQNLSVQPFGPFKPYHLTLPPSHLVRAVAEKPAGPPYWV